jgi:outer membrane protein OmpA-like peptidoglycan-associated protein/tetratricopeptide (TPR) repeat protein
MEHIFAGTQIHENSVRKEFMKLLRVILFMLFFSGTLAAGAQQNPLSSQNKKAVKLYRNAEQSFLGREYEHAISELKKSVEKDPGFVEAWLLLGDASAEAGLFSEAVHAYKKAAGLNQDYFPYALYLIGNLEYKLGNYQSALDFYKAYLSTEGVTENELKITSGKIKLAEAALAIVSDSLAVEPVNLGNDVNSSSDEYVNFVDEDITQLYLTRKEPNPDYALDGNPFRENFYISFLKENVWDSLILFDLPLKKHRNVGGMSFSIDRKQIYFTGCSWPTGIGSCDLYRMNKTGNEWGRAHNLGVIVNTGSWDSQPFLSSDGKTLYFASKRTGGKGGSDIWMTEKQPDGSWGTPVNLGDSINTSGNEMAPYIHADTKTLYFSSDTRAGLGGYDLFMSKKDSSGRWRQAVNLGSPVNTRANEINIFISMDASTAWISSDRKDGEGGYDIYEMKTVKAIQPEAVVYVKGKVVDRNSKKPLQALVELSNVDKSEKVVEIMSDPVDGSFFIPVYPGVNYAFHITKKGYLFYSENMNLKDTLRFSPVHKTFELTPVSKGNSFVLNNIFFDFDSFTLKPASFTELNLLASLLKNNPSMRILIKGHTDNTGTDEYNLLLSENRAKAVYDYLTEHGIKQERLQYKGFGATQPVSSNETSEGRAENRRTEIEIL